MKILKVIAENLGSKPAAVPLPESVPTPAGFHGRVLLDPGSCIGCGMCAYVCVSNAIVGKDQGGTYLWQYDAAACAFCGRCVERCPARALSQAAEPTPCYDRPGGLVVRHVVAFAPCLDCGEPTRQPTPGLLETAYPQMTEEQRDLLRRCERCRRKRLVRRMAAMNDAIAREEKERP